MAEPNSDEQNTTSYITFLGEKLHWLLMVHDGYNDRLATIGRLNVYTVKR